MKKKPAPKSASKPTEAKPTAAKPAEPAPPGKPKREPKASPNKKPRASGLNAAAQVLAKSKEPMSCTDLTQRILEQGMWKTGGKTPAATINAAILREIKAKGAASRFRKAGRGLFAAGKSAR